MVNYDEPRPMGDKSLEILAFIDDYQARRGFSPTYREIGDAVGLSSLSAVSYRLKRLEQRGKLKRQRNIPRSIVLKPSPG